MYGNWQPMEQANMGSYNPFCSPPNLNPPNHSFMNVNTPFLHQNYYQEEGMNVGKIEQEMDGGSGGGGGHADAMLAFSKALQQSAKKKGYRHTERQIQVMESIFKECPNPDAKLRERLSQELGLTPNQVKFWFQNRRTLTRVKEGRSDNAALRSENEMLKEENLRLQSTIRNLVCLNSCGWEMHGEMSLGEQHLSQENARLKEELGRRLSCNPTRPYTNRSPPQTMSTAAPPFLPSLDLDMGMFPASNLPEQLPIDFTTVPTSSPSQPWGGGEEGGGEGAAAPPFLPSLDLDMGMFAASNLPEQLPIDFTTVPTSSPSQPWGGGEEGGGEGAAAPPFLPSLDLDMGMFPASNLPEQLPIYFTTVPTSSPSQPWGGGEEGGGEGAAAVGSSGRAGDDGGWPPEEVLDFW